MDTTARSEDLRHWLLSSKVSKDEAAKACVLPFTSVLSLYPELRMAGGEKCNRFFGLVDQFTVYTMQRYQVLERFTESMLRARLRYNGEMEEYVYDAVEDRIKQVLAKRYRSAHRIALAEMSFSYLTSDWITEREREEDIDALYREENANVFLTLAKEVDYLVTLNRGEW